MRKTKGEKLANNMKKRYLHATFHDQTTDIKRTTSDAQVIKKMSVGVTSEKRQRLIGHGSRLRRVCIGLLFLKVEHELTAFLIVEIQFVDSTLVGSCNERSVGLRIALQILQHIVVDILK